MKIVTTALLALVLTIGAASAADVNRGTVYTPDSYAPSSPLLFSGLGVEAGAGYAMTAIELDDPDSSDSFRGISADGLTGVVGLDYMFAAGKWRFGPYGEIGLADVTTQVSIGAPFDGDILKQDLFYGGGLALGFVEGTSYFGVRVGYEFQDWKADFGGANQFDVEAEALLLGVVYSMALLDNVELKLTVDALDYQNVNVKGESDFPATEIFGDSLQGRAMARIVYRPDFR